MPGVRMIPLDDPAVTFTEAFDAIAPTTTKGDIIVSNGSDNVRLAVGTDGQMILADSASAAGIKWANFSAATANIQDAAVTYAKMQDVSATSRVLGRKTSGSGDTEECTISDVLGFVSATQGVILYCGASSTWAALGTGTVGKVLMTGGAAANPSWGYRAFDVTIQAASGTDLTWTNMPAAQTLWLGTGRHIFKADLGDYQQVRLLINVRSVAANAGSTVDVMYSTSYTETIGSLSAIGTSACQVTLGSTSTILDSGWIDLAAGAKAANVFVALVGAGGDGAIDPTFGGVHVQFR